MAEIITIPVGALVQDIEIDISRVTSLPKVYTQQYDDKSRYIRAKIWDNGIEYPVGTNVEIEFACLKPSLKGVNKSAGVDNDGNIIFLIEGNVTAVSGLVGAEFRISDEVLGRRATPKFYIDVDKTALDNDVIIDSDDFDRLTEVLREVQEALNRLQDIEENEQERQDNEEERQTNEIERKENELERQDNEEERKASELIREDNEEDRVLAETDRENKESERQANELVRIDNEEERIENELERIAAEELRPNYIYLTQAEYDALPESEKEDRNIFYEITDNEGEFPDYLEQLINEAIDATQGAIDATGDVTEANNFAKQAESNNHGGVFAGDETDNSKYYMEQAKMYRDQAEDISNVGIAGVGKIGLVSGDGNVEVTDVTGAMWADQYKDKSTSTGSSVQFTNAEDGLVSITSVGGTGSVTMVSMNNNIINPNITSITQSGITATIQNDKSYILNGTSSATGGLFILGNSYSVNVVFTLRKGTYVLRGTGTSLLGIYLYKADGTTINTTINNLTFTLATDTDFSSISLRWFTASTVLNNVRVYPQVSFGSTLTAYEPHKENTLTIPDVTTAVYPLYLTSYKGITNLFTTSLSQPTFTAVAKSKLWSDNYILYNSGNISKYSDGTVWSDPYKDKYKSTGSVVKFNNSDDALIAITTVGGTGSVTMEVCKENLLDPSGFKTSYTLSGLTITRSSNNTITLNGTTTAIIDIYLILETVSSTFYTKTTEMYNKVKSLNGSVTMSNNLGLLNYFGKVGGGFVQNTIETAELGNSFIRIPSGTTYTNTVLNVQIEFGSISTPYKQYYGNQLTINDVTTANYPLYLTSYKGINNVFTLNASHPTFTAVFKSESWSKNYLKDLILSGLYDGNISKDTSGIAWANALKDKSNQLTGTSLTFTNSDDGFIDLNIDGKSQQTVGVPSPSNVLPITSLGDSGSFIVRSENSDNSKNSQITINSNGYSLPNGTKDVFCLKNGKKTKNVAKIQFDGSSDEVWTKAQIGTGSRYRFYITVTGKKVNGNANSLICDKLSSIAFNLSTTIPNEPCTSGHNTVGTINIYGTMFDSMTVSDFKTWLSTNVLTYMYELDVPVVSYFNAQLPVSYKGTTNVTIIDTVQPTIYGTAKSEVWSKDYTKLSIGNDYRPNLLFNGDFQLWNRGTSFSKNTKETADKWFLVNYDNTTSTSVGTMTKDAYGCKITGAGTTQLYIRQYLSSINYSSVEGKPITLSADLKATTFNSGGVFIQLNFLDSNLSSLGIIDRIYTKNDIGVEFKRFSLNGIIPVGCKTVEIAIGSYGGKEGGIINSTCTLYINNVKLEQNDHATPFIPKSYNEEMLNISNNFGYTPNLLFNGDFNLNRNGKSVYVGVTTTNTVDRWRIAGGTLTVNTNKTISLKMTSGAPYLWLDQIVEKFQPLNNKTISMSAKIDGNIIHGTSDIVLGSTSTTFCTVFFKDAVNNFIDIYWDGSKVFVRIIISDTETHVVEWIKLELNDYATQFIPKSYNEEVLNCSDGIGYTPNILINGDFSINQRGLTTYNAYGYTVDRWRFGGALITGQSVEKTSFGIKITSSNTEAYIEQYIEDGDKYLNKRLTLSICDSYNNIYYGSSILTTSGTGAVVSINPSGVEIGNVYFDYPTWFSGFLRVVVLVHTNQTLNIKWVKIELNDRPTPFIPRPIGEELALCQRYYEVSDISADNSYQLQANSTKSLLGGISFKVKKRVNPTVGIASQIRRINTGELITVVGSYNASADTNGLKYIDNINVSSPPFITGEWYSFAYIADAEI